MPSSIEQLRGEVEMTMRALDERDQSDGAMAQAGIRAPKASIASTTRRGGALRVLGDLSVRTTRRFCRAVEALLAKHAAVAIDLVDVKSLDVVGLAALLQASERAAARSVALSIRPGPTVHAAALRAQLMEELPFVTALVDEDYEWSEVYAGSPGEPSPLLAQTPKVGLRPPTWDELPLFTRWATDPLLEQMVGSELLYQFRHLGPHHPDVINLIFNDPTALTLVVEPLSPLRAPVGFVRLYQINLVQQFAFLETAVATVESLRRGWGIEASRLFLAYGLDVLHLHRIEAKAYAYNVLSTNSLKRNGFQSEGVLRRARTYGGQRWDILLFSILEEEMREQRRAERYPDLGLWSEPC
jgi:RimJ/RimL family protein N-acetyltransferase/ABC-type transporter Mla MlaB component